MGTIFRLYFPQVADEAVPFSPVPPDERSLMGSETVLLVEDEQALRDLGKQMLEPTTTRFSSPVMEQRRSSSHETTRTRSIC